MSGHSKWSTIKHKKAARDHARGNVFTKMANAISVAVKTGGSGDPDINFSLRLAIDKARAVNMPNVNINRAIDKGLGKSEEGELSELLLEGYGPEGIAMVVEAVTDNHNRTVAEVKNIFDKAGGSLGEPGSVMYQFDRVGEISFAGKISEDDILMVIDMGAIDVVQEDEGGYVYCKVESMVEVVKYMKDKYKEVEGSIIYKPKMRANPSNTSRVEALRASLEDNDDVQNVYDNT